MFNIEQTEITERPYCLHPRQRLYPGASVIERLSCSRLQKVGAAVVIKVECRIMPNRPGPGWYWEVVESREVLARGLADTHREAASQAAEVARTVRGEQLKQSA